MSINSPKKSKRGRPAVESEEIKLRMQQPTLGALDAAISQELPAPSRQDMIRRIVTDWLSGRGLLNAGGKLPSDFEIKAAARELSSIGEHHGWWPKEQSYSKLDPIGREEFEILAGNIISAASRAVVLAATNAAAFQAASTPAAEKQAAMAEGQAARAKLRKAVEMPEPAPSKREVAAGRAKELAIGAVKQALAHVDAPDDVKLERKRKLVAPPATEKIRKPK